MLTAFGSMILLFFAGMNLLAVYLYGSDKRRAIKRQWRIRESVLLGVAFFGGAVGALFAMTLFRHKTRHLYFWAVALLGLAWQLLAVRWFLKLPLPFV